MQGKTYAEITNAFKNMKRGSCLRLVVLRPLEAAVRESYSDSLPDFVKLAEAYGWKGIRIETVDQLEQGIADMLTHDGPVFVDCMVEKHANCFPMIPSGATHTEMLLGPDQGAGKVDKSAEALV